MGVVLTHLQIVAGVHFATLVAGYHPGGDTGGAHQEGKAGRVVLAEALAGAEQELVDGVAGNARRLQGVEERLLAEIAQCGVHQGAVVPVALPPALRQGARLGVALLGQVQHQPPFRVAECRHRAGYVHAAHAVTEGAVDRAVRHQPEIPRQGVAVEVGERHRQGVQPALPGRLHNHPVTVAGAVFGGVDQCAIPVRRRPATAVEQLRPLPARRAGLTPGGAVEIAVGEAAPVALPGRRRLALKLDAERQLTGFGEAADLAR